MRLEVLDYLPKQFNSVLDVGVGYGVPAFVIKSRYALHISPTDKKVKSNLRIVGVDAFDPWIDWCEEHNIYDQIVKCNIEKERLPFESKSFDVAIMKDVLEHLPKDVGKDVIMQLERIARKRVLLTTLNKWKYDDSIDDAEHQGNPFLLQEAHWNPSDFRKLGYKVRGVGALGFLNDGKGHYPRGFKIAGRILELASHRFPSMSWRLLAYKSLE